MSFTPGGRSAVCGMSVTVTESPPQGEFVTGLLPIYPAQLNSHFSQQVRRVYFKNKKAHDLLNSIPDPGQEYRKHGKWPVEPLITTITRWANSDDWQRFSLIKIHGENTSF